MPDDFNIGRPKGRPKNGSQPAKAVTLVDVAAHAGVSAVAVSVVLNNSKSQVRVSQATRERILESAKVLQYEPNGLARSLRLQRTNIIGFYDAHGYIADARFPFHGALLSGLQIGCQENHKDLLLHSKFKDRSDNDIYMELLNGQVDGLVLYARSMTSLIERLVESRLPIVSVVNEVAGVPCVGVDNTESGRLMGQHVAECGYKNVLFRLAGPSLPSTLQKRLDGFNEVASTNGITVNYMCSVDRWPSETEQQILLSKSERPELLVAYSDYHADGIVEFCRENGIRIPDDISIAGFDDLPSPLRPSSRLTTIHCPWMEVAQQAVASVVARRNGDEIPEHTELPVYFVQGETTRKL